MVRRDEIISEVKVKGGEVINEEVRCKGRARWHQGAAAAATVTTADPVATSATATQQDQVGRLSACDDRPEEQQQQQQQQQDPVSPLSVSRQIFEDLDRV